MAALRVDKAPSWKTILLSFELRQIIWLQEGSGIVVGLVRSLYKIQFAILGVAVSVPGFTDLLFYLAVTLHLVSVENGELVCHFGVCIFGGVRKRGRILDNLRLWRQNWLLVHHRAINLLFILFTNIKVLEVPQNLIHLPRHRPIPAPRKIFRQFVFQGLVV